MIIRDVTGAEPVSHHIIGRLTAPIMWFFICEGYHYTRDVIELIKMPDGNYSLNYAITATQKAILKAFDIDAANIRKQAKNISTELVAKEA